jgi:hypothetical protein
VLIYHQQVPANRREHQRQGGSGNEEMAGKRDARRGNLSGRQPTNNCPKTPQTVESVYYWGVAAPTQPGTLQIHSNVHKHVEELHEHKRHQQKPSSISHADER